jgi:hypothetical protein
VPAHATCKLQCEQAEVVHAVGAYAVQPDHLKAMRCAIRRQLHVTIVGMFLWEPSRHGWLGLQL